MGKLIVILIIAAIAYKFLLMKNEATIERLDDQITYASAKESYTYGYSKRKKSLDVYAVMLNERKQAGIEALMHHVDADIGRELKAEHSGSGICPAPKLNRHASQTELLPASPEIAATIDSLDIRDYTQTSQWQHVKLSGHCLTKLIAGEKNGQEQRAYDNAFDNCRMLLVDSVQIL